MDFSECLKRIYQRLDDIAQARVMGECKRCAEGIRAYVDEIARQVDYEEEEDLETSP